MDITLQDLNALDEISIRTTHSEYRFRLTEPRLCRGVLTGGVLGEVEHDAVLGTGDVTDDEKEEWPAKLEIGGCALFYVAVGEGVSFMTTSKITDLALVDLNLAAGI